MGGERLKAWVSEKEGRDGVAAQEGGLLVADGRNPPQNN